MIIASNVHNETLSIRLGEAEAAVMFGKSRSQAARYLDALEEKSYLIVKRGELDEYGGMKANLYILNLDRKTVDSESKNDPTPRVINESRLLIKNCSLKTKLQDTPPNPPAIAEGMCVNTLEPIHEEPQRPAPDPEVRQAEHEARRWREERRARKAVARQAHYAKAKAQPRFEGRSRRHHEAPMPVQEAANEVMRLNGVAVPRRGLRRAVEAAIELTGLKPSLCVEDMAIAWAEYQSVRHLLFGDVGMERFYGDGAWCNPKSWRYDRDKLKQRQEYMRNSIGTHRSDE